MMASLGFQTKSSNCLVFLGPEAQIKKQHLNKRCLAQVLLSICRKFPPGQVTGLQKIHPINPCDWSPQPFLLSLFVFPMPMRSESLGYSNCRENKTESAVAAHRSDVRVETSVCKAAPIPRTPLPPCLPMAIPFPIPTLLSNGNSISNTHPARQWQFHF